MNSKYDISLDLKIKNSLSVILDRVNSNSTVLEFGPANGRMTKYLKEKLNCKVYAVEIDSKSAKDAEQFCEKIIVDDVEKYTWLKEFSDIQFDYIIFADVLEHLYFPQKVLEKSKSLLQENGSILISVPNIAHNAIIMELLNGDFTYRETGLLDNTHIRFFTKTTLDILLNDIKLYKAYETGIYENPMNTEFGYKYSDLPLEVSSFLKARDYGEVYQFIYELKKVKIKCKKDLLAKPTSDDHYAQLYIDTGNGFNEEMSIKKPINNKEFDLSSHDDIKSIRFDPINDYVQLKIHSLKINDIVFDLFQTNAFYISNDIYYFNNDDPQIYINIDKISKIKKLYIDVEYLYIGDLVKKKIPIIYEELLEEKRLQLQQKNQQLEEKNQQLEEKGQQLEEKGQQILHRDQLLQLKDKQITNLTELANSMRIKNRLLKLFRIYKL